MPPFIAIAVLPKFVKRHPATKLFAPPEISIAPDLDPSNFKPLITTYDTSFIFIIVSPKVGKTKSPLPILQGGHKYNIPFFLSTYHSPGLSISSKIFKKKYLA